MPNSLSMKAKPQNFSFVTLALERSGVALLPYRWFLRIGVGRFFRHRYFLDRAAK